MKFAKTRKNIDISGQNELSDDFNSNEQKPNKIVKRNWRKITIIAIIISSIIIGTTLGVYYAIRPAQNPWPSAITKMNSGLDARNYILEKDGQGNFVNDEVVVYMGADDCNYCQYAIYGEGSKEDDFSEIDGPYGIYGDLGIGTITPNIALTYKLVGSTEYMFNDLFFIDAYDIPNKEPRYNELISPNGEAFYKIDTASLANQNALSLGSGAINSDGTNVLKQVNIGIMYDSSKKEWFLTEGNSDSPWGGTPTWLYFKSGVLRFYMSGIVIETDEETNALPPTSTLWTYLENILNTNRYPEPN